MRRVAILQVTNFTQLVNLKRSQLVIFEIVMIFITNITVSWLRFGMDLEAVLFEYPAIPKIFVYPLIWYLTLSLVHGWDRSIIAYGNELFSRALSAAWRSLFIFATFAYLIKFPISRVWVAANIFSTLITVLIIRVIIRRSIGKKYREDGSLSYLYIGLESTSESSLLEFKSNFGFAPKLIVLEPPVNKNWEDWIEVYKKRISEKSLSGVIVGYGEINDASVLKQISDIKRNHIVEFILISKIAPLLNRFESLDNPTLLRVKDANILGSGAVIKRIFDFVFSVSAILVLIPFLLITAVIIKLTSKGPVLYVDKRVGKDGVDFVFPKFRSMYQGSDEKRLEILGRPDSEMLDRYKKDPRITPFGRFIRRWSIDELPQLWCVVIGTMSIVGPRPILREEVAQIKRQFETRFIAKPGLTGLWQVTGRKEVAWDDRMLRDIAYIEDWNLSNDIVLIIKTISAIFSGRGAH